MAALACGKHVFPWVGHLPVETVKPTEIVRCLQRIKARGNLETAQRARGRTAYVPDREVTANGVCLNHGECR